MKLFKLHEDELFDKMAHSNPNTPYIIGVPLIGYFLYLSIGQFRLWPLFLLSGGLFWVSFEYFLHRVCFHFTPKSKLGRIFYKFTHGVHHNYPDIKTRCVIPAPPIVLFSLGSYFIFKNLVNPEILAGHYAFSLMGYIYYEYLHYRFHFNKFEKGYFKKLQEKHLLHHDYPKKNYGLTTTMFDYLFKTRV